jgi:hypothetical protein
MTRNRKPTIRKSPASAYAGPHENIYEVGDSLGGALISVLRNDDGILIVNVYRADDTVLVIGPTKNLPVPGEFEWAGRTD